ncbi:hypothetical protein ABIE44_003167 [Marmoricola sp. OAE513]|uniref:hypothetical protein n=1 Tax=Marmoricola sp. OAE513 TaxID=2817894 RepID=UPI001AE71AE1
MIEGMQQQSLAARIAIGVAAVALPLGMVAAWIDGYVADTDRYVDAVAPLADDPEVQNAVADALAGATIAVFSEQARETVCGESAQASGNPLDGLGGLGGLASALVPLAEGPIRAGLGEIVRTPTFAKAWGSANRSGHEQLLGVLDGDDSRVDENGCVSLDLSTVLQEVTDSMTGGALPIEMPDVDVPVAMVDVGDLSAARTGYSVLKPLGVVLPLVWVVAVAVALVTSRRRGWTLVALGAASAAGMLGVLGLAGWVRSDLIGASADAYVTGAIWDAVSSPLRTGAVVGLVISLVAAVAGGWLVWRSAAAEGETAAAR